eukprot:3963135-Amphidinium_carterae.1
MTAESCTTSKAFGALGEEPWSLLRTIEDLRSGFHTANHGSGFSPSLYPERTKLCHLGGPHTLTQFMRLSSP